MKVPRREAGLHKMEKDFGVDTKAADKGGIQGPGMFDYDASRRPLGYIPEDTQYRVIPADTGIRSRSGLTLSSGAFADHTTGRCFKETKRVDTRVVPESQWPGSMNNNTMGLGVDVTRGGALRSDMKKPVVEG